MPRLTGRVLRGAAAVAALAVVYVMDAGAGGTGTHASARREPPGRNTRPAGRAAIEPALTAPDPASAGPDDSIPPGSLVPPGVSAAPDPAGERAVIAETLRRLGDRWARFYTAAEFSGLEATLNGWYSGVGLWLAKAGSDVRIVGVQPGSPAEHAGVRPGDVVSAVDGTATRDLTVAAVAAALRGRPATGVGLAVRRDGVPLRFALVRTAVPSHDVSASLTADGVVVIRIAAFTRGVGREVRAAVAGRPGRRGGVLLDLRANPGGLLDEAVDTASVFLPGGPVATFERAGAPPERLLAGPGGDTTDPLVVLVDGGTASAAEVVAGSLRDRDRAVIVGSRTFGKGSVQEPLRLADGSAIELTVGRYRTPSGRNLDGSGIDPDVAVNANRPPREAERRALTVVRGLSATLPKKDRG
ncbi:S41 family peptidase [Actinoallomurus rhizosphaericola]|uniref:S41 family peptidase n=1 Tax=Actinoallomurus rhizosphaericola TaxID=2952536 RepID=UPI00209272B5|nr:S41 family peptidase [Actinoallomurus rhizosphaericola]MCO5998828.1 S41 family peptidase [Actinoallomurus rhizosphaericola]